MIMDKEQAIKIERETFESAFNREKI